MPIVSHLHSWTQTAGGLQCVLGPCTAFMSLALLQANVTNGGVTHSSQVHDYDTLLNQAWKKSGGN